MDGVRLHGKAAKGTLGDRIGARPGKGGLSKGTARKNAGRDDRSDKCGWKRDGPKRTENGKGNWGSPMDLGDDGSTTRSDSGNGTTPPTEEDSSVVTYREYLATNGNKDVPLPEGRQVPKLQGEQVSSKSDNDAVFFPGDGGKKKKAKKKKTPKSRNVTADFCP